MGCSVRALTDTGGSQREPREDLSWLKVTATARQGWKRAPLYKARPGPHPEPSCAQTQTGRRASGCLGRGTCWGAGGPDLGLCSP